MGFRLLTATLLCIFFSRLFNSSEGSRAPQVYRNVADWVNAVYEAGGRIRAESFNDTPENYQLPSGKYDLDFMSITVEKEQEFQGFYQDFFTNDGQYFIGYLNKNNTFINIKPRSNIGGRAIGFGAEWVDTTSTANLTMTVNGYTTNFSDYLTSPGILNGTVTGNGFLGFVLEGSSFDNVVLGVQNRSKIGEQFFMDNALFAIMSKNDDCMSFFYP
jgi:hypothetical protein